VLSRETPFLSTASTSYLKKEMMRSKDFQELESALITFSLSISSELQNYVYAVGSNARDPLSATSPASSSESGSTGILDVLLYEANMMSHM
jgi:hypothetical protein